MTNHVTESVVTEGIKASVISLHTEVDILAHDLLSRQLVEPEPRLRCLLEYLGLH
jgi:hypothetical protein